MTKSIKYIVVIALILLLILYFLQKPTTTIPLINEVSLLGQTEDEIKKPTAEKPKETTKIMEVNSDSIAEVKTHKIEGRNVTYLTAYREFEQFNKCLLVYEGTKDGVDLISNYIQSYVKPNETQIQYYQIYIDLCQSLLLNEKENRIDASTRLSKRIDDTIPKTEEEIALSQALEIQDRINDVSWKIYDEKSGNNQLTEEQIAANLKRTLALGKELMIIMNRNVGEITDADRLLILKLINEQKELTNSGNVEPNAEEIEYLQKQLKTVVFELKEFFANNQTPDVFLIFADHLLNEERGRFFFTDDLNSKMGIYDTDYINALNKIIVPFIACSLDYPCGPESYLSITHCTHPVGFKPTACGKSIEDYYLDDLISPNQMIDFNNYFNYLLDNYAQK